MSLEINLFKFWICLSTFSSIIFLPTVNEHTFYIFVSKEQNEAGNSVPLSLEVGIEAIVISFISLGTHEGSLFKI